MDFLYRYSLHSLTNIRRKKSITCILEYQLGLVTGSPFRNAKYFINVLGVFPLHQVDLIWSKAFAWTL